MLDNHGFGLENAKSALAKRDVSSMTLEDALLLITAKQEEEEDNEKNEDNRNDNDKILQSFLTSRQTSGRRHQSLRSIRSSFKNNKNEEQKYSTVGMPSEAIKKWNEILTDSTVKSIKDNVNFLKAET